MKPSLDNAYARIIRANEHLVNIRRECSAIGSPTRRFSENTKGIAVFRPVIGNQVVGVEVIFSILVGECIYNLRAALDYLVYELAILDSGKIQHGTQFPIEDTTKGWKSKINTFLKGVSIKHQAAIERLQPCNRVDWTKRLRNLSNPDKHRCLSIVRLGPVIHNTNLSSTINPMKVYRQLTSEVTFNDGSSVIKTIEEFKSQITLVLDQFNPDF